MIGGSLGIGRGSISTGHSVPVTDKLILWLRSDLGTEVSSNKVVAWKDQSGKFISASNTATSEQPWLSSSAWENWIPTLGFNGKNLLSVNSLSSSVGNYTAFFIHDRNDTGTDEMFLDVEFGRLVFFADVTNKIGYGTSAANTGIANNITGKQYVSYKLDSTNNVASIYRGGSLLGTGTIPSIFIGGRKVLGARFSGGTFAFSGSMTEVLFYEKILTDNEMSGVHNYIKDRYKL